MTGSCKGPVVIKKTHSKNLVRKNSYDLVRIMYIQLICNMAKLVCSKKYSSDWLSKWSTFCNIHSYKLTTHMFKHEA